MSNEKASKEQVLKRLAIAEQTLTDIRARIQEIRTESRELSRLRMNATNHVLSNQRLLKMFEMQETIDNMKKASTQ